jgi:hypothetical protein
MRSLGAGATSISSCVRARINFPRFMLNVVGTRCTLRHHWLHAPCQAENNCMQSRHGRCPFVPPRGKGGVLPEGLLSPAVRTKRHVQQNFKRSRAGKDRPCPCCSGTMISDLVCRRQCVGSFSRPPRHITFELNLKPINGRGVSRCKEMSRTERLEGQFLAK